MSDHDQPNLFERVEAAAGVLLFVAFSLSFVAGMIFVIARAGNSPAISSQLGRTVLIAALIGAAELGSAFVMLRAFFNSESSFLLSVAAQQPRWPRGGHPAVVTWWLWHFVAMIAAPEMFFEEFRARHAALSHLVPSILIPLLLTFGASVAANALLLLALDTHYRGKPILRRVYEWRFAIDILAAVLVLAAPNEMLMIFRVPFVFLFRFVFRR
jgi:hypothetical protein